MGCLGWLLLGPFIALFWLIGLELWLGWQLLRLCWRGLALGWQAGERLLERYSAPEPASDAARRSAGQRPSLSPRRTTGRR